MRCLVFLLPLAACVGDPEPSQRFASAPDQVTAIDRSLVVGRWTCSILDPPQGMPDVAQATEFDADGKARSRTLVETGPSGLAARYEMTSTWDWGVAGERLTTANVDTQTRAVDGSAASGMLAGLTGMITRTFGNTMQAGSLDVLRLDREQLMMRAADTDEAPVFDCRRA